MRRSRLAAAAIFAALAAAGVGLRAIWPSRAIVWCDNGTDDDLVIRRDGDEVTRVQRHQFRKIELSTGEHRLDARASERSIDEVLIDARRGTRSVWNVGGAQRYAVYTMTYGQDGNVDGPREIAVGERLFYLPADVAQDFMQPLPSTMLAPHGSTTATARALYHYPLHAGRACCHTK
jgi:hypothetical protein